MSRPSRALVTLSLLLGSSFGCAGATSTGAAAAGGPEPTGTTGDVAPLPTGHVDTAGAFLVDPTFATNGVAQVATPKSEMPICTTTLGAVEVGTDGIYIGGSFPMAGDATLGGCDGGVMRLALNGKIDTAFGKGGVARIDEVYGFVNSLAIGPDGAITTAGAFLAEGETTDVELSVDLHFAAMGPLLFSQRVAATSLTAGKLTRTGALDAKLGNKGALRFRGHPGMLANAVLLGPDGATTIVGSTKTPKISEEGQVSFPVAEGFALRLGADGQPDPAFGAKGVAYFDAGGGKLIGGFVSQAPDGKLVFVGEDGPRSFLVRTTRDLKLDTSYGAQGFVSTVEAPNDESIASHYDAHGGAVLATLRANNALTLRMFDANGKPVTTFGPGGRVTIDGEPTEASSLEVVRKDGVVFHFAQYPGEPPRVWRIDAAGQIDPVVRGIPLDVPGDFLLGLATLDASDRIVVVYLNEAMDLRLVRYTAK